jgi:hypothetical protein
MSAYSDAVLALNPSSYWRFEQGAPLSDSGSGGVTLTAVGSPTGTSSLVPSEGPSGQRAYSLDGSSYLTGGDNYSFAGDIDFTVAMWAKPLSANFGSGFQRLMSKRVVGGDQTGWLIFGSGTDNITFDFDPGAGGNEGLTAGSTGLTNGTTKFLVWVWSDSTPKMFLYVDGAEFTTDITWTISPVTQAGTLTLGGNSGGTALFVGVIDEVAVWSGTMLTAPQIANLYAIGSAPFAATDILVPRHGIGMGRW